MPQRVPLRSNVKSSIDDGDDDRPGDAEIAPPLQDLHRDGKTPSFVFDKPSTSPH